MTAENCTVFADFIFLGLSGRQDVQQGLFVLFLLVYGITVIASVGMVLLIKRDPRLHTPMYYFLSNLSFCDICCSLLSLPRCWLISYLSKKGFRMMYMPSRCTFLEPLQMWNVSCWLSWFMTIMWPFAIHFFIQLPCPGKSVPSLWLLPTL